MIPSKISSKYKDCIAAITLYIVIIAMLVFFEKTVIAYTNYLTTWFNKKLPIGLATFSFDIALIILSALVIIKTPFIVINRNKYPLMAIWGATLSYFLLEKISFKNFHFTEMYLLPISYALYFFLLLPFSILLINTIKQVLNENSESNSLSLLKESDKLKKTSNSDTPILSEEEDAFEFSYAVKKLVDFYKGYKSNSSYVVGLQADWGDGKSSFLNLFTNSFNNYNDVIVVNFNPWLSHTSSDIINDFFNTLSDTLEQHQVFITSDLKKYRDALLGIENTSVITQAITSSINLFQHKANDNSKLFKEINDKIIASEKRIIIVIDDIDRLHNEEIFEVLKLVRNSGSFKNTFFILAYSKSYIINSLEKMQIPNHEDYLEKIIQMELSLPPYKGNLSLAFIKNYLNNKYGITVNDELLSVLDQENLEGLEELIGKTPLIKIKDLLRSPRTIKRFVDNTMYDYFHIKDEVDFQDFFIVKLLKFINEDLYFKLSLKNATEHNGGEEILKLTNSFNDENKEIIGTREKHLLNSLFEQRQAENGFNYSSRKSIYFTEKISNEIITKEAFNKILSGTNDFTLSNDLRSDFFAKLSFIDNHVEKNDNLNEQVNNLLVFLDFHLQSYSFLAHEKSSIHDFFYRFLKKSDEMNVESKLIIDFLKGNYASAFKSECVKTYLIKEYYNYNNIIKPLEGLDILIHHFEKSLTTKVETYKSFYENTTPAGVFDIELQYFLRVTRISRISKITDTKDFSKKIEDVREVFIAHINSNTEGFLNYLEKERGYINNNDDLAKLLRPIFVTKTNLIEKLTLVDHSLIEESCRLYRCNNVFEYEADSIIELPDEWL